LADQSNYRRLPDNLHSILAKHRQPSSDSAADLNNTIDGGSRMTTGTTILALKDMSFCQE
jgi:hypothetical protein